MYFVYILRSLKDGNFYVGRTNDVARRLNEHNHGRVQSTRNRAPFILMEKIEVKSIIDSVMLEREYKKGYKREEIKKKYGGVA